MTTTSTTGGTTSPLSSALGLGASGSTPNAPGGKMGKDEFIKLLVAQLKNQDPMNPAEGQEMAAQLAQFSSVEQLINMNTALSSQAAASAAMIGTMQASAAMNAIGKTVVARGNHVAIDGDAGAQGVTAYVGGTGGTAILHVFDSTGKEVGTQKLGYLGGGEKTIGFSDKVKDLPAGDYTYALEVTDFQGKAVDVQTYMTGVVQAMQMSAEGPVLLAGSLTIPYSDVVEIRQ